MRRSSGKTGVQFKEVGWIEKTKKAMEFYHRLEEYLLSGAAISGAAISGAAPGETSARFFDFLLGNRRDLININRQLFGKLTI
jgi:hypothetical protein